MGWAKLPNGSQFGQLRLPPHTIRGCGSDISSFFRFIENPKAWLSYCAVGRPFRGRDQPEAKIEGDTLYYVTLRVWAMGIATV